jgi:hypothetical protein
METKTEDARQVADYFNPMTGWEAASRWNAATFDWMAKGLQQWIALLTVMPRATVVAPPVVKIQVVEERPVARAESKRPPRAKARAKIKAPKARTRG